MVETRRQRPRRRSEHRVARPRPLRRTPAGRGGFLLLANLDPQAACIYYVGIQLLLPGQDAGIDLAREYALAQGMESPNPNP
jgi:hypothetical protein